MSGPAQSAEISRGSGETTGARPVSAERSLGQRAAEGLKKTVGSARDKMKKWINGEDSAQQKRFDDALQRIPTRDQVQKEVQAQAAEAKRQDDLNAANESLSPTARMFANENASRASGARAHSEAVQTINGATSGEVHSSTGALAENQQQTKVTAEGAQARTQADSRLEAEQHARLNHTSEEQVQAAGTEAGSAAALEADRTRNRTRQEQASASSHAEKSIEASEDKPGLPKTQVELDGMIAKAVAEAVAKAGAEQSAQIAQLTSDNEKLKADLADRPTVEQMNKAIEQAVAKALAKPAAEAPKPEAAQAATPDAKTEAKSENPEIANLQTELADVKEMLADVTRQMSEAQQAARASLLKQAETTPGLKEKVLGTQNWLALLIAGGGVIGMGAAEDNKKKAMAQAA